MVVAYTDVAGEPKEKQVDAVTDLIRAEQTGAVLCIGGGSALAADPPSLINYQGVLRDNVDVPLTGDHDMVFRFFDSVVGIPALLDVVSL